VTDNGRLLAGSGTALLAAIASGHWLTAALAAGGAVALAALAAMMRYQRAIWERAASAPLSVDGSDRSTG
jgi:hypothetical protein